MEKFKEYESPEMEIFLIEACDVITTSTPSTTGPIGGGGFGAKTRLKTCCRNF